MPMKVQGSLPPNLQKKDKFGVEINGFDAALFTKGKWPSVEFDECAFSPAGSSRPFKSMGRAKFEDLTFEKGISVAGADTAALDWVTRQMDLATGSSDAPDAYMRDVDLVEYDTAGAETRRCTLHGAWIKKYEGDEHDGGSSEVSIEKITICYQYFTTK